MRTDDLIAALAADQSGGRARPGRFVVLAWGAGLALAAGAFFALIGVRADVASAVQTLRFDFKVVLVAVLAIVGVGVVVRLGHPVRRMGRWGWALGIVAGVALLAVVLELATTPPGTWGARLIGSNIASCLTIIPALSIVPAGLLLIALRRAAPTRPRLAGAAVGLLAAATSATLYALNCTDDSPLFVVTWYTVAGAFVAALSAWVAGWLLEW